MIGVLVSGEGTNLQALLDAGLPVVRRRVEPRRRRLRSSAPAAAGVPAAAFELDDYADRDAARRGDGRLARRSRACDLVVCAGYMHLLTPPFLDRFPERIVNMHPSLLPDVPGRARDRGRARRRGRDDRRHRPPRRRGARHRRGDPPGARARRAARDARPSASTAVEHRLLPEVVRAAVRALISVYDKTGLDAFAKGLAELGLELVASGGTATLLEELGLR